MDDTKCSEAYRGKTDFIIFAAHNTHDTTLENPSSILVNPSKCSIFVVFLLHIFIVYVII